MNQSEHKLKINELKVIEITRYLDVCDLVLIECTDLSPLGERLYVLIKL